MFILAKMSWANAVGAILIIILGLIIVACFIFGILPRDTKDRIIDKTFVRFVDYLAEKLSSE